MGFFERNKGSKIFSEISVAGGFMVELVKGKTKLGTHILCPR